MTFELHAGVDEISGGVGTACEVNVQVRRRYILFSETRAILPARCGVKLNGEIYGTGVGKSKQAAEKIAASVALKKLNVDV